MTIPYSSMISIENVNVKKDQKARVCAYDADNDERFDTV
jgi:hypothetical protein